MSLTGWVLGEFAHQMNDMMAAYIEIQGMIAENKHRESRGESLAYTEADFVKVAQMYGMDYNSNIEKHCRF